MVLLVSPLEGIVPKAKELIEAERQKRNIPGVSAAIVYDQEVVWAGGAGYADPAHKTGAGAETIYSTGSITKVFTASALMHLRDAGKLSLDDPVLGCIPELSISSPAKDAAPFTFRQALAHVSGLPREASLPYWQTLEFPTADALVESLQGTALLFPPLTEINYSNVGFALIGLAIARICEQPYETYVMEKIVEPLGLKHCSFSVAPENGYLKATGYGELSKGERLPAPDYGLHSFNPAGGLWACVNDLAALLCWQMYDGPADERHPLGATTLREMRSPVFIAPSWEDARALPWELSRLDGHTVVGYGGAEIGYSADLAFIPSLKLGVVVAANCDTNPRVIVHGLLHLIAPEVQAETERQTAVVGGKSTRSYTAYVGRYSLPGVAVIDLSLEKGELVARSPMAPGLDIRFEPQEEHMFRMVDGPMHGELAQFEMDDSGQAMRVKTGPYTLAREGSVGRVHGLLMTGRAAATALGTIVSRGHEDSSAAIYSASLALRNGPRWQQCGGQGIIAAPHCAAELLRKRKSS